MKKNNFKFCWEYGDYGIRTSFRIGEELPYIELVKYEDENHTACFTLAIYNWKDDGGNLTFIGSRPFKYIPAMDFPPIWNQLGLACNMLDEFYNQITSEY